MKKILIALLLFTATPAFAVFDNISTTDGQRAQLDALAYFYDFDTRGEFIQDRFNRAMADALANMKAAKKKALMKAVDANDPAVDAIVNDYK